SQRRHACRDPGYRCWTSRKWLGWFGAAQRSSQIESEIVRRVEALLWILLEAVRDHVFQPAGNLFSRRGQLGWLSFQNRRQGLRRGLARDGEPPRDHFIQHAAKGENIAASVGRRAPDLFRRHIAYGPQDHAFLGDGLRLRFLRGGCPRAASQAEIQN